MCQMKSVRLLALEALDLVLLALVPLALVPNLVLAPNPNVLCLDILDNESIPVLYK